ncbi:MAG: hypothetical protein GYA21_17390 [Myxococcales bacterium]|nr:hypothetical protein [Myxococcales bacterium]
MRSKQVLSAWTVIFFVVLGASEVGAQDNAVPFIKGVKVETAPSGFQQHGQPIIRDTLENTLRYDIDVSKAEMEEAISKRTASRWCLGLSIPLLIGSTVNLAVGASGTVGSKEGELSVYAVAGGLAIAAGGLAIASLVLSNKSAVLYQKAIDHYNASLESPATSIHLIPLRSGMGAALSFRM